MKRALLVLAVFGAIQWDPWLRFRDLDFHEHAQLGWTQHVANGWKPGRDMVYSYGPLHGFALAGFMKATSWSVVGERWYWWAAQTAGCALLWWALRTVCVTRIAAAGGMALVLLLTPAFWHWYGWANSLRQGLALAAMFAAVRGFGRATQHDRIARGALLGIATLYSPEAGIAAVAGTTFTVDKRGAVPAMQLLVGLLVTLLAGLLLLCSGSLADRVGAFTEPIAQFAGGFRGLPYDPRGLGAVLPAVLLLSTAGWIGAGGLRHPLHLPLLVFGWIAYRGALGRSDLPHFAHAAPAACVLVAWHLEQLWTRTPRTRAWRGTAAAATLATAGFALATARSNLRGIDGMAPVPNIVRSKSPGAFRMIADMKRAGLRIRVDHPRIGGLWLTPAQADQVRGITRELERRTKPGDAIFTTGNAEIYYFLADRTAANRYPYALHALAPEAQAGVAASLDRCAFAITDSIVEDGFRWDQWQPVVAGAIRRSFTVFMSPGPVTLHVRTAR